jgi:hypothetical protein
MIQRIARILAALFCLTLAAVSFQLSRSSINKTGEEKFPVLRQKVGQYPWRAEGWYILGCAYAYDLRYSSPDAALRCFVRAVNLNPWNYKYWAGVSDFLAAHGRTDQAILCMAAALRLNQSFTDLYWRAANFYVRLQRYDEAARCFRQTLRGETGLLRPILAVCWRSWPDRSRILEQVVPATTSMRLGMLGWCIEMNDAALAQLSWKEAVSAPGEFQVQSSFGYIEYLLRQKSPAAAYKVWLQALSRAGIHQEETDSDRVYNGGFERPLFEGGFGWRIRTSPHLSIQESLTKRYQDYRSLRIEFDGEENWSGPLLTQYVWLETNGPYRLEYAILTENLTTDKGLYFAIRQVFPAEGAGPPVRGPEHLEDSDWLFQSIPFDAPRAGTLVEISLQRDSSRKFDCQIRGRAWVDDIHVTSEEPR